MLRHSAWGRAPARGALPSRLRSWLLEPGSLTQRCQGAAATFRVRRVFFGLLPSLMASHGASQRPQVATREVLLECDGVPVIFAHTELARSPRGRMTPWMQRLGNRSLGSLLFARPEFARGALEFRRLHPRDALYRRALAATRLAAPIELWARRSQHRLGRQSVLVTEVFLPAILEL